MNRLRNLSTHFPLSTNNLRSIAFHSAVSSASAPSASQVSSAIYSGELRMDQSDNGLIHIVLNRPKALNALSFDQITCLSNYVQHFNNNSKCKAVLITGDGDRAFCAGGDVASLVKGSFTLMKRFVGREYIMDYHTSLILKPYIAIWDGITMGGGVGLSNHAGYRVATCASDWAMPETAIGFVPDVGMTHILSRLPDGIGLYLGLTGARLNASDLMILKLATHFVPRTRVPEVVSHLKTMNISADTAEANNSVNAYLQSIPATTAMPEPTISPETREKIARYFGTPGSLQAIIRRLEADADTNSFCAASLATIRSKCPLSCAIWFKQHNRGGQLSLADCFRLEFKLALALYEQEGCFVEGVRSVLIDKHRKPRWIPATIEEVSEELVDRLFEAPQSEELDDYGTLPDPPLL